MWHFYLDVPTMFGEQLGGVFSSVSLSERWRLIISYLTEQWIAASLLTLLCQVNVPFFKWWREGRRWGYIVDSEMMISHLTLCCCLLIAETNIRNKEITLACALCYILYHPDKNWMFIAVLLWTSLQEVLKCDSVSLQWLLILKCICRCNVKTCFF